MSSALVSLVGSPAFANPETFADSAVPTVLDDPVTAASAAEDPAQIRAALNHVVWKTREGAGIAAGSPAGSRGVADRKADRARGGGFTGWDWVKHSWPKSVSLHHILEELLNQRHSFIKPIDLVWGALESPENRPAVARIIALMILGDTIPSLVSTANLRRAVGILQAILDDPNAHPKLRALALAIVEEHQFLLSGANPTIPGKLSR